MLGHIVTYTNTITSLNCNRIAITFSRFGGLVVADPLVVQACDQHHVPEEFSIMRRCVRRTRLQAVPVQRLLSYELVRRTQINQIVYLACLHKGLWAQHCAKRGIRPDANLLHDHDPYAERILYSTD